MTTKETEAQVEEFLNEFKEHPASKHVASALTTEWIRNGKKDWEGETTIDCLNRMLRTALATAEQRGMELGRRGERSKIRKIWNTSTGSDFDRYIATPYQPNQPVK